MGGVGLGDDHEAGGVFVEPMDNPGAPDPADPRETVAAARDQRVDEGAAGMAGRGMDDEPGRLVDDDKMLVLVDDVERQILPDHGRIGWRRRLENDPRAFGEAERRIARRRAVDLDLAGLDQRLEPGARECDAALGRGPAEEPVEPLAGPRRVDQESLGARRHGERAGGSRLRRGVGIRRLDPAPGAALGPGVHGRSRRRTRPLVSAAGGATSGPSAATMASRLGRGRAA